MATTKKPGDNTGKNGGIYQQEGRVGVSSRTIRLFRIIQRSLPQLNLGMSGVR